MWYAKSYWVFPSPFTHLKWPLSSSKYLHREANRSMAHHSFPLPENKGFRTSKGLDTWFSSYLSWLTTFNDITLGRPSRAAALGSGVASFAHIHLPTSLNLSEKKRGIEQKRKCRGEKTQGILSFPFFFFSGPGAWKEEAEAIRGTAFGSLSQALRGLELVLKLPTSFYPKKWCSGGGAEVLAPPLHLQSHSLLGELAQSVCSLCH